MAKCFLSSLALIVGLFAATHAYAEIQIEFSEDAPKDFILISNKSQCDLGAFGVDVDLTPTAGKLIFDTIPGGVGENVAQRLEIVSGGEWVSKIPTIQDGEKKAKIMFHSLPKGQRVLFSVDVDDTIPSGPMGQQMIADSEMKGGEISISVSDDIIKKGTFNGKARILLDAC